MKVGLVLSGGMAKGAYQIGALKAIQEYVPPNQFQYVSCSSVGVLNGYAFVTQQLDAARRIWDALCKNNNRLLIGRVLKSNFLQQAIQSVCSKEDVLENPFYVSLLNLRRKTVTYTNLANVDAALLPRYLQASVAMPIYNPPVVIGGEAYFDGAMADNIPVYPLTKHTLDYLICIYFDDCCYTFENVYFDNKVIKITFPAKTHLTDSLIFRGESIQEMIRQGYDKTAYTLRSVFAKGTDDLECIYRSIEILNEQKSQSKVRITGDVLVTNINKVAQRIARRKVDL